MTLKNLIKYSYSILFWSMISAAFIGPGTVITALSAGQSFSYSLLWTLGFATLACIILQEAVGRLTIASGKSIGEIMRERFTDGTAKLAGIIILVGCIAYQAGNITGAALPIISNYGASKGLVIAVITSIAFALLIIGKVSFIARSLGIVVAIMGIGFVTLAVTASMDPKAILSGFTPAFPADSSLLILGLIGTTIVPYNLFLGSGAAKSQDMSSMKVGIIFAVLIGGLISMAILLVGTLIPSSENIANAGSFIGQRHGHFAAALFAAGLFSAGFTSSVTAPLAAAMTVRSTFSNGTRYYKPAWLMVLLVGAGFAYAGGSPIPLIIFAQALNGLFLPLVVYIIIMVINDRRFLSNGNGHTNNLLLLVVFFVTTVIGLLNVARAVLRIAGQSMPDSIIWVLAAAGLLATCALMLKLFSQGAAH